MSIFQQALQQIEDLRLKIVDHRVRCISAQSAIKIISTEERIQNFRDTQRMIEEGVQVAQKQIMLHGSIDWKCAEFAYLSVDDKRDDISAQLPHENEHLPGVDCEGSDHHLLIPTHDDPSGHASHASQNAGGSAHIPANQATDYSDNIPAPRLHEHKSNTNERSPPVQPHVSDDVVNVSSDNIDFSPHFPTTHEKVRSWLETSPQSSQLYAGPLPAQGPQTVVPQLASFDPLGEGGFFHALAEGINAYLLDAGLMSRNGKQLTPQKLSGAMGAYLAFHLTGNKSYVECTEDQVTVDIIQCETLMGFSKKPVSGSLINILQQSPESVARYAHLVDQGKVVYLRWLHLHNLAHMTGCKVCFRDNSGHTIREVTSRSPDDDNPVITLTITHRADGPTTRDPTIPDGSDIVWDGIIPIYNIGDHAVHSPYLFSAQVARVHTKRWGLYT
jgi:hypothetical protein